MTHRTYQARERATQESSGLQPVADPTFDLNVSDFIACEGEVDVVAIAAHLGQHPEEYVVQRVSELACFLVGLTHFRGSGAGA